MRFEISVAKHGKPVFTADPGVFAADSPSDGLTRAVDVFYRFATRFAAEDGYCVTLTSWTETATQVKERPADER
jgi:hypothetical protein